MGLYQAMPDRSVMTQLFRIGYEHKGTNLSIASHHLAQDHARVLVIGTSHYLEIVFRSPAIMTCDGWLSRSTIFLGNKAIF